MANVDKHDPVQGKLIHEYDGIYEADNGLPNWLTAIFFGTTAFAVAYWFYYQEFEIGQQPGEAYAAAMQEKLESVPEMSDEELRAMADDPEVVSAGRGVFVTNCAACHEENGGGKIGPNLTDDHWIHGGSANAIHNVVQEGVAAKGMPAWGPTLGPEKVQQVTAYVMTLRGTNVEGGKEAEGELWQPKEGPPRESEALDEGEAAEEGDPTVEPEDAIGGEEAGDEAGADPPEGATDEGAEQASATAN